MGVATLFNALLKHPSTQKYYRKLILKIKRDKKPRIERIFQANKVSYLEMIWSFDAGRMELDELCRSWEEGYTEFGRHIGISKYFFKDLRLFDNQTLTSGVP